MLAVGFRGIMALQEEFHASHRRCGHGHRRAPDGFGELIGGSARETDNKKLITNLKREKTDPAAYDWYLDIRRFGSVPHCGFGMGLERLTMWICNLDHIRDAIEFPRTINRVYP